MQFGLEELGYPAPPEAQKQCIANWGFTPSHHPAVVHHHQAIQSRTGTGGAPNILMPRPKKQARAQTPLLPIPPPGAPQNITKTRDGKKRIQPTFLGMGGIVPRQGTTPAPEQQQINTLQPAFQASTNYAQPGPSNITTHDVEMMEARMHGTPMNGRLPSRVSPYLSLLPTTYLLSDRSMIDTSTGCWYALLGCSTRPAGSSQSSINSKEESCRDGFLR